MLIQSKEYSWSFCSLFPHYFLASPVNSAKSLMPYISVSLEMRDELPMISFLFITVRAHLVGYLISILHFSPFPLPPKVPILLPSWWPWFQTIFPPPSAGRSSILKTYLWQSPSSSPYRGLALLPWGSRGIAILIRRRNSKFDEWSRVLPLNSLDHRRFSNLFVASNNPRETCCDLHIAVVWLEEFFQWIFSSILIKLHLRLWSHFSGLFLLS